MKRFMTLPGSKYIRVHLANGTCFPERGRRCGPFDVFRGETQASAERKLLRRDATLLRRYRESVRRTIAIVGLGNSTTKVRYSICLECSISNAARRILATEALRFIRREMLVDSIISGSCLEGLICEKHGDSMSYTPGQRCISDTDGKTLFEADIQRLKRASKQCEAVYYWSTGFNLLPYGYRGSFIPPHERRHRASEFEFAGLDGSSGLLRASRVSMGRQGATVP